MIPELHDIGKLLGLEKHWFEGVDPSDLPPGYDQETWLAIRYHGHKPDMSADNQAIYEKLRVLGRQPDYPAPIRRAMVLLSLADGVSSSSRVLPEDAGMQVQVQGYFPYSAPRICLWRDSTLPAVFKKETHGNPSNQQIRDLLADALSSRSWEEFFRKYQHQLNRTPEDKHPLRAMTSLAAHCDLDGKIFRLLDKAVMPQGDQLAGNLSLGKVKADSLKLARNSWRLFVVRADIQLPQRPAHAQDVNIFPAVHKAIEQIATGPHSDHILLATSTALWLIILPEQEEELDAILQPLLDLGVNISCAAKESPFNHIAFLDSDELKAAESNSHRYYAFPALPAEIGRDICEICQMRAGRQQPPDIDTGIVETLCDSCRSIRQWGNRFRNLGDWSEGQVLWCRMELNSKSLPGHISALYREYLQLLMYAEDGSPVLSQPEQVEDLVQMLQPAALLAEYAQDYRRFLMTFWKRVRNGLDRVQLEANTCLQEISGLDAAVDLFAVKMERHGIAEVILNAFRDSLEEWFPMSAKRGDCPVRLGLSVAHAKHPFFLHWNLLKDLIKTIQFSSAGRPPARMNLQQLGVLQQIAVDIGRSYLYDLAAIERRTGSRLMVEMKIISDRRHRFSEMARRAGIAISDVLVYHAMVNAGGK